MGSTTTVRSGAPVSASEHLVRPRNEEVRAQLARILASPLFQHSKHYPALLRYVVNEALDGRAGQLKERALGVEVFGRTPDYDTNADPVVRTSACEVRKRIAQYYHEAGRESEVRIDLASGSYAPEFRYAAHSHLQLVADHPPAAPPRALPWEWLRVMGARPRLVLSTTLAVVVLGAVAWALRPAPAPVEQFWNPVWGSADPLLLAIGSPPPPTRTTSAGAGVGDGPSAREVMRADQMPFSDALTMARVTGLTYEYGRKKLDIRRAAAFSLTDLRKGPAILIGGFNNSWTMRLNTELRFSFEWNEDTHTGRIRDRQNPSNWSWAYDPGHPYATIQRDYAVVSRFQNPLTEKMVVVVAGMGRDGTIAAGEFVTEPRYLELLARRAPRNWERKNLQVLLATDIVNGTTGPPQILETYFW